jgi:hypothetical protein
MQSMNAGSCRLSLECQQSALIGDVNIALRGPIQAACSLFNDTWTCACQAGTELEETTVNAEDASEACAAAAEACPTLVGIGLQ